MLLLLLACPHPLPPAPPVTAASPDPVDPYAEAVEAARYLSADAVVSDLLTLTKASPTVQFDDAGRVRVQTWTRADYYSDPAYVTGHAFPLYGEMWFTAGDAVAQTCQGLEGAARDLRLEQLLGLPAGGGRDAFLVVYVDPSALFRPCSNPDPMVSDCRIAPPIIQDGDVTSLACQGTAGHAQWVCNNYAANYSISDASQQYPWTVLGYTYDWSADGPVGPAEFIAPASTEVVFEALLSTADFCAQ
ncbi:MAG: hypothetical protein ACI8RZ_004247 [Myxococcota bacterium]|jgi:hypothetical protein